mgnify:CR=1 FL=1
MKNRIILGCILFLLLTIYSCSTNASIKIKPRKGTGIIGTMQIDIGEKYQFRTYDKIETESGCTVTLYFDKRVKDENE